MKESMLARTTLEALVNIRARGQINLLNPTLTDPKSLKKQRY
jgi:hypothetical protein